MSTERLTAEDQLMPTASPGVATVGVFLDAVPDAPATPARPWTPRQLRHHSDRGEPAAAGMAGGWTWFT
jgi:hypothetical protein